VESTQDLRTVRLPLFCDTALAGRIERAEAQLMANVSEAAHRYAAPGRRRTGDRAPQL